MKMSDNCISVQNELIDTFITEYMVVKKIDESSLKDALHIEQDNEGLHVVEGKDKLLSILWKRVTFDSTQKILLDIRLENPSDFPDTESFIRRSNNLSCYKLKKSEDFS